MAKLLKKKPYNYVGFFKWPVFCISLCTFSAYIKD